MAKGWTATAESFDWDSITEEAPPPPDDGIYRAEVTEASPEQSQKGNPGVSLTLELREVVEGGGATTLEGRSTTVRFERLILTQKGAWKVKQAANACGVAPPASSSFDDLEEFAERMLGSTPYVRVKCVKAPGSDAVYPNVRAYIAEDKLQEVLAGAPVAGAPAAGARGKKTGRRSR